ncbi:hypothetical protein BJV74DRAFT_798545 [Russula compacta]|nr:hypothetical protein BJV74DRAFT_798545 [Russula compacta]
MYRACTWDLGTATTRPSHALLSPRLLCPLVPKPQAPVGRLIFWLGNRGAPHIPAGRAFLTHNHCRLAAGNPQKYEITGNWGNSRQGWIYRSGSRFGHFILFLLTGANPPGRRVAHVPRSAFHAPLRRGQWVSLEVGREIRTDEQKESFIHGNDLFQLTRALQLVTPPVRSSINTEVAEVPVADLVCCIYFLDTPNLQE